MCIPSQKADQHQKPLRCDKKGKNATAQAKNKRGALPELSTAT